MSESLDRRAREVVRHFLPGEEAKLHALQNAGGFSGANLWRVNGRLATWCLRAWPPDQADRTRLRFIHELQQRASDLPFVPRLAKVENGCTIIECDSRLWELATWQPGIADYRVNPTPARLRAACRAMAQLHAVWSSVRQVANSTYEETQPCPAVLRRLDAYNDCLRHRDCRIVRANHPLAGVCSLLDQNIESVPTLLQPWLRIPVSVWPCLCDCWHDHFLFKGDDLTGLIDYGATKVDHVSVDLARLLGSLAGNDETAWAVGLAAYREVLSLSEREEALVRVLDRTGCILALWTWVRRLLVERRRYPDLSAVKRRLCELAGRFDFSRIKPGLDVS